MKFTIFGAEGFIGSHLTKYLIQTNFSPFCPSRDDNSIFYQNLGHVIYCIGVTVDFRERPFDTVQAHVCKLLDIFNNTQFDSFLYLSSTRLYLNAKNTEEETTISVNSSQLEDLYSISKLMGESLCFASKQPNLRVVRLSNVYAPNDNYQNTFLDAIIQEALNNNKIRLRTSLNSTKDYININDVVSLLIKIATKGHYPIYNLASGKNVTNQEIIEKIHYLTHCKIEMQPEAKTLQFPRINIQRLRQEFNFEPSSNVIEDIPQLIRTWTNRH